MIFIIKCWQIRNRKISSSAFTFRRNTPIIWQRYFFKHLENHFEVDTFWRALFSDKARWIHSIFEKQGMPNGQVCGIRLDEPQEKVAALLHAYSQIPSVRGISHVCLRHLWRAVLFTVCIDINLFLCACRLTSNVWAAYFLRRACVMVYLHVHWALNVKWRCKIS